jgi:hypothetical protein
VKHYMMIGKEGEEKGGEDREGNGGKEEGRKI